MDSAADNNQIDNAHRKHERFTRTIQFFNLSFLPVGLGSIAPA
jgi:hypothetical protein